MQRGSDKHSPRMDDAMAGEVRGMMTSGHDTHADESLSAEPSGEDQPDIDRSPDGALHGGVPDGMTDDDVEARSLLAGHLGKEVWPAPPPVLIAKAQKQNAPDAVLAMLARLPDDGRDYANLQEVWTELSGGIEQHRF